MVEVKTRVRFPANALKVINMVNNYAINKVICRLFFVTCVEVGLNETRVNSFELILCGDHESGQRKCLIAFRKRLQLFFQLLRARFPSFRVDDNKLRS